MGIFEYIVYGVGILLALGWMIGIRSYMQNGQGMTISTVNTTMLFIVSLFLVLILEISPLHLLWMYPLSLIFGLFSLSFPFSLLSIAGNIVGIIACLGLNADDMKRNQKRIIRATDLIRNEGLSVEEANKRLDEEGY